MEENEKEKMQNTENETKAQEINKEGEKAPTQEVAKEVKKDENKVVTEKKQEQKFKKVETKPKKSKHTVAKTILILIGLAVIVYFIFVMRNYIIFNDIREKASAYNDVTNYTYHTKTKTAEYTIMKKDNITRLDITKIGAEEENTIMWYDSDAKEGIIALPNQNKAKKVNFSDVVATAPFEFTIIDEPTMGMILYSLIYTDEFDGKECYVIDLGDGYKKWVEKDTGLLVKTEQESDDFSSEITNIEINTIDEVYKPDLTGYEVTDATNNTVE